MFSFWKIWCLAALFPYVHAETRKMELLISNVEVAPDGIIRSAIGINGQTPGPLITANKGDDLEINVINQLVNTTMDTSTSVHWHGIFQHHTNAFDGASFVTQCPILSGDSFLYKFSLANQSGTFWYHSHYNLQYCDGLRGAIVIYDPEDPYRHMYDVDDESTIITLTDWFHTNMTSRFAAASVVSTLVNGKGRYTSDSNVTLSVTHVEQGKRYRLRVLNIACNEWLTFSIDNHNFTVIEADGQAVLPHTVDAIPMDAGQRYSIVLEANQPVDNYWIRAESYFTNNISTVATLRYRGAPEEDPKNKTWPIVNLLNETDLHARDNPVAPGFPYPGGADVTLSFVSTQDFVSDAHYLNGIQYIPPDVPTLLQILSGTAGIAELASQGSVYTLPSNKVIEISFPGSTTPHPMHLHGHAFYVVRSAGSSDYNFVNPVQRDTVDTGYPGSNATIRFVTDNAGPWFLHCHIDFHLWKGMAVVLAEDPSGIAHKDPVDSSWRQLCVKYNNTLGA